jgi:hypothetical protein
MKVSKETYRDIIKVLCLQELRKTEEDLGHDGQWPGPSLGLGSLPVPVAAPVS